jgi:hypothetical protein
MHYHYPPMPVICPSGTVFHYPQYRWCQRYPWLYKLGPNGERIPVDYDKSPEAEAARKETP